MRFMALSNTRHQLAQSLLPGMGINLRGDNTLMAEQNLDVHQLHIFFQQPSSVSVPELVQCHLFVNAGLVDQFFK
jgi:hypothetical protein